MNCFSISFIGGGGDGQGTTSPDCARLLGLVKRLLSQRGVKPVIRELVHQAARWDNVDVFTAI